MARHGYYDEQYGFVPYDDCPQDNLYSESEAKHTFSPSEPMTNADRIRGMTDEEMADAFHLEGCPKGKFITDCLCDLMREPYPHECKKCWLDWLKQENETN